MTEEEMKYENLIRGNPKTYIYKTVFLSISGKNKLKLRIAWDEERFLLKDVSCHDGNKFVPINKIYLVDNKGKEVIELGEKSI